MLFIWFKHISSHYYLPLILISRSQKTKRASAIAIMWWESTKTRLFIMFYYWIVLSCLARSKTSWIAMFCVLPPSFNPVNNLICCKTGLMWVVKRATLQRCKTIWMFFCRPFLRTLNYLCKIDMKTKSFRFDFRFSPDMHTCIGERFFCT